MPTVICPHCKKPREVSASTLQALELKERRGKPALCGSCANVVNHADKPRCVHCKLRAGCRRAGLCQQCFETPAIRALYPSTSPTARHGNGSGRQNHKQPLAPTTAAPGTPEKVAVLEARADRNEWLFHPADARYEGDPRPLEFLAAKAGAA